MAPIISKIGKRNKNVDEPCFVFLYFQSLENYVKKLPQQTRGESRNAATSKMERFVVIVNGFYPLTIITKGSILDVAAVLDPSLQTTSTGDLTT